jgi:hypothetical protein
LGNLWAPAHEWFGIKVPGTRASGGDTPDNHYRIVPVDGRARYEVRGKRFGAGTGDAAFSLTGSLALGSTLGGLDWRSVQFDNEGNFVITLDHEPANGRPNHIQTTLDARFIFIRDCRADWREVPNALRVARLDPPTAPPLTFEQLVQRAAFYIAEDVPQMYWFISPMVNLELNKIAPPFAPGAIGGLVTQMMCFGRLKLEDDEALVVTMSSSGATFRDIVVYDRWFRTPDYADHSVSMNIAQSVTDSDGSSTYVISVNDPGIHNWIDPAGCHDLYVMLRWQGMHHSADSSSKPSQQTRLVKMKDLDRVLPTETRRITVEGRRAQLAERRETLQLRFADK